MTLKSRSVLTILIAIILIVGAILVWANQTGRITMFASAENLAAKQEAPTYEQLLAGKMQSERKDFEERAVVGIVEQISGDKISIRKINSEEKQEFTLTDSTIITKIADTRERTGGTIDDVKKDMTVIVWLKADNETMVEQIDLE